MLSLSITKGRIIVAPFDTADLKQTVFAFACLFTTTPWIIDLVLVLRLAAVYPPKITTRLTTVAIFAFPVVIKIVRLVMIILYNVSFWGDINKASLLNSLSIPAHAFPYSKAEWILQIFDNGFVHDLRWTFQEVYLLSDIYLPCSY
jgi:hypothetical protein